MPQEYVIKYNANSVHNALDSKYLFAILRGMRYTIKDFKAEYPDDAACLKAVLDNRYGKTCPRCGVVGVKFHPITGRKGFVCSECDRHIYPLADTIFRKSETSLWNWFYAIYLFSVSKNGVSAKELERALGCTYKTAWRMAKQIRLLMAQDTELLTGTVQADDTLVGGFSPGQRGRSFNKHPIIGAVEKYGRVRAQATEWTDRHVAKQFFNAVLDPSVTLHVDDGRVYVRPRKEYEHGVVNHSKGFYSQGGVNTNAIEGFWSQLKRSIDGTYHVVSPKYLQLYVDEFAFRYNFRDVPVCPILLERAARLV